MKSLRWLIISLMIILLAGRPVFSQELKAGQELPELRLGEKTERFWAHLATLYLYVLEMANEDQVSPEQAGRQMGAFLAQAWGQDTPPAEFVRSMQRSWQVCGVKDEITEVGEGFVRGRRTHWMSEEEHAQWSQAHAFDKADFEALLLFMQKEIASQTGLEYEEEPQGEYMVFTVSSHADQPDPGQDLKPGEVLPDMKREETLERCHAHLTSVYLYVLDRANDRQISPEEAGRKIGRFVARFWPQDPSPETYIRNMHGFWQVSDVQTRILEVDEDFIRGQRSHWMSPAEYEIWSRIFGMDMDAYDQLALSMQQELASRIGISYEETAREDHVEFSVSKKQ